MGVLQIDVVSAVPRWLFHLRLLALPVAVGVGFWEMSGLFFPLHVTNSCAGSRLVHHCVLCPDLMVL